MKQAAASTIERPPQVQLRSRRSPRLIAIGVLCLVLGALGAATLYSMTVQRVEAVVMVNDVSRGQLITANDVGVVELPGTSNIEALPADQLDAVIGETALTDLPAGAFPTGRSLGADPIPAEMSLVGLRLANGRLPVGDLPVGTQVALVSLLEGAETVVAAEVRSAPVWLDDQTGYALNVWVASEDAPDVALLAATDQLALIATEN